jgi:hypothetical protein
MILNIHQTPFTVWIGISRAWAKKGIVLLAAAAITMGLSCNSLFPTQSKSDVPGNHTMEISGVLHKSGLREPLDGGQKCSAASCHGSGLRGGVAVRNGRKVVAPSCYQCHEALWENGGEGGGEDD